MPEYAPIHRLRECAQVLLTEASVVAVEACEPDERFDYPTLEVAVDPTQNGVPPGVLRTLADWNCHVEDVDTRGSPRHYVVVGR